MDKLTVTMEDLTAAKNKLVEKQKEIDEANANAGAKSIESNGHESTK